MRRLLMFAAMLILPGGLLFALVLLAREVKNFFAHHFD